MVACVVVPDARAIAADSRAEETGSPGRPVSGGYSGMDIGAAEVSPAASVGEIPRCAAASKTHSGIQPSRSEQRHSCMCSLWWKSVVAIPLVATYKVLALATQTTNANMFVVVLASTVVSPQDAVGTELRPLMQ